MRLEPFRRVAGKLLIWLLLSQPALCEDFASINLRVSPSILRIVVAGTNAANQQAPPSPGTGFVAYADTALPFTFIFTAAHVIGKDEEWLLDNDNKPVKRTIAVLQAQGLTMVPIGDAAVIRIDHEADVAVLAIPKRAINPIPLAGFDHLKQLEPLMMSGFPANENKQVPIYGAVRAIDYSKPRIEIDRAFTPGQSGGPVIDAHGWAVGIASENNDKLVPTFHKAAVVSAAAALLNSYLGGAGRPQLVLKTPSATSLVVSSRSGRAKIRVTGDSGALARDLHAEKTLADATSAELDARGEERSECDEGSGRTLSSAQARALVQPFENNGLKIPISLTVQGGHYRTAVTCLAGQPVGLTGHDTAADASADVDGQIDFELQTAPLDLRVIWKDMPPGTQLVMVGPDGTARLNIEVSGASEKVVQLNESGRWHLQANLSQHLRATGGSGREQYNAQSILVIALQ